MAEDITSLLFSTYSDATKAKQSIADDNKTIVEMFRSVLDKKELNKDGTLYGTKGKAAAEKKEIEKIKKAEKDRYIELYKSELEYGKYSQKVKKDLIDQEIIQYTELYNLKQSRNNDESKHWEELRDVYQQIAEGDKVTLGNLAEIYTKRKQIEKDEKAHLEYKAKKFEEGVNTFKAGFKKFLTDWANFFTDTMWLNQWKRGLESLGNEYESRFTEIAGRTGSATREDAHDIIANMSSTVVNTEYLDKGLNFNADVFPAITDAVKKGFQGEKLEDVAITNAIDKKIMPWLETDSETWVNFQYNLSDDLLRQIKGQQLQLQATQEGNRILQNGVVSALLDELSPTLLNIDANTTDVSKLSTDAQATVAYLMKSGYSQQDAIKIANQAIKAYQNPYDSLTSNNPIEILMGNTSFMGGDLEDILGTYGNIGAMGIGTGPLGMGAIQQVMGVNYGNFTKTDDNAIDLSQLGQGPDWKQIQKDFSIDPDAAKQKYIDEQTNLTEHVTATQAYDNNQENWMTDAAMNLNLAVHGIDRANLSLQELVDLKNWLMGIGITIIVDKLTDGAISKFGSKFGNKLFGKLGGKSSGTGPGGGTPSGSGGLKSPLGKLGSTWGSGALSSGASTAAKVTGFGAAALGTGVAIAGISDAVKENNFAKDTKNLTVDRKEAKKDAAVSGTAAAIGGIGAAVGLFASGPIGLAIAAVGGLVLGVKKYNDHLEKVRDATATLTAGFVDAKQKIQDEHLAREDNLKSIKENVLNLDTTSEKLQYLRDSGLNPTITEEQLKGKTLKEVNKELDLYLTNLILENKNDSKEDQKNIDEIGGKLKTQYNKDTKELKDQIYGQLKGKSKDEQYEMLSLLGYTDEELDALFRNKVNGAASDGELWRFLDKGGDFADKKGIESFSNKLGNGKIRASDVNSFSNLYLDYDAPMLYDQSKLTGDELSKIYTASEYIMDYKDYGRSKNRKTENVPHEFKQESYNEFKDYLTSLGRDYNSVVKQTFKQLGYGGDVTPDTLKTMDEFRLGSQWLARDGIFYGHEGERVLTKEQNKQYTESLQSSNGVLQAGFQDVVAAIQSQTAQIIDAIASMRFNRNTTSTLSMLPEMGNTRVVL